MIRELFQTLVHDALVLFAMVNVVGNLPVFADLTAGMNREDRNRAFRVAVTIAFGIVLAFAVLGNWMLQRVFQVSTDAFKVAGGAYSSSPWRRGECSTAPTAWRRARASLKTPQCFPWASRTWPDRAPS